MAGVCCSRLCHKWDMGGDGMVIPWHGLTKLSQKSGGIVHISIYNMQLLIFTRNACSFPLKPANRYNMNPAGMFNSFRSVSLSRVQLEWLDVWLKHVRTCSYQAALRPFDRNWQSWECLCFSKYPHHSGCSDSQHVNDLCLAFGLYFRTIPGLAPRNDEVGTNQSYRGDILTPELMESWPLGKVTPTAPHLFNLFILAIRPY